MPISLRELLNGQVSITHHNYYRYLSIDGVRICRLVYSPREFVVPLPLFLNYERKCLMLCELNKYELAVAIDGEFYVIRLWGNFDGVTIFEVNRYEMRLIRNNMKDL